MSTAGNISFLIVMLFIYLHSHDMVTNTESSLPSSRTEIMLGLTSAGAVLDFIVEKLGDEDQVCEDVEHHSNYLRERQKKESQFS